MVAEDRLDEVRYLLRQDPLVNIRKVCYYLANYTPEVGQSRQNAVKSYKAMIAALERFDTEALRFSRKQSKSDMNALYADLGSKMDSFIAAIPNQLK